MIVGHAIIECVVCIWLELHSIWELNRPWLHHSTGQPHHASVAHRHFALKAGVVTRLGEPGW